MKSPLLCPPLLPGQRPLSCLDRQRFKAERRGASYMWVCLMCVCVKEKECECVMKAGKVNEWVENEKKQRWEFTSQLLYGNTVFSESTHCHTVEHSEINREEMVMKSVCGLGVKLLSYSSYQVCFIYLPVPVCRVEMFVFTSHPTWSHKKGNE